MADFVAVNGIRTTGEANIDRLTLALVDRGHNVVDLGLPVIGPFEAASRKVQMRNGRMVHDAVVQHYGKGARVNVIAHSNGIPTTFRSMWYPNVRYDNLFLFNGAMRSDWCWPAFGFRRLYNVHNPHDKALQWGRRSRWIMPNHIFGDFGRTGYDGPPDRRIENISNPFKKSDNYHNPWYDADVTEFWADWITERT